MKRSRNSKDGISVGALLDSVPVPNVHVTCEKDEDGVVVLRVPVERKWYCKPPFNVLFPVKKYRRIALDKLGTEVWKACTGKDTVEKIVEHFARVHHLSFHESRSCIMQFLRDLTLRGLMVIVGPSTENSINAAPANLNIIPNTSSIPVEAV